MAVKRGLNMGRGLEALFPQRSGKENKEQTPAAGKAAAEPVKKAAEKSAIAAGAGKKPAEKKTVEKNKYM